MAKEQSGNMIKRLRDIFGGGSPKRTGPFTITEPFKLAAGRTTREICRDFELQDEAKTHLSNEPTPEQFVERLARAKLYVDATRFLAYGLPKREAVWWACLCVRNVPACCGDDIAAGAMQAAAAWVKDPSEEKREIALTAGGRHNFEMPSAPAAWVAMAAGWSGGAAMDEENVPAPSEYLTAHAASGAIILAVTAEHERTKEMYRKFLETGVQIAQGKMQISA